MPSLGSEAGAGPTSEPSSRLSCSEYALEDILRSGLYSEATEQGQEVQWKGARKQRPRNPFQSSERPSSRQVEDGPGAEDQEEEEFQQLYADLQRSGASSEGAGGSGQFEEIYENLVMGPSSCLPPEIYSLHMESHTQRMGILSRWLTGLRPLLVLSAY